MLKVTDCIEETKLDLTNVFAKLGVRKAVGELDSSKVYYLENFGSNIDATKGINYFIYDISSLPNVLFADDISYAKEVYVIMNLYTRKTPESKEIKDLVSNLEDELIALGYSFELSTATYYNSEIKTWCLSFESRKTRWLKT